MSDARYPGQVTDSGLAASTSRVTFEKSGRAAHLGGRRSAGKPGERTRRPAPRLDLRRRASTVWGWALREQQARQSPRMKVRSVTERPGLGDDRGDERAPPRRLPQAGRSRRLRPAPPLASVALPLKRESVRWVEKAQTRRSSANP